MSTLYLIRGLPGSGKTTFAKELQEAIGQCCTEDEYPRTVAADDFMVDAAGQYEFNAARLFVCHKLCQDNVQWWMQDKVPDIIVHNTFTTERELDPYLHLANAHGYRVVSLVVENRHGNSSVHNVPADKLEMMRERFTLRLTN